MDRKSLYIGLLSLTATALLLLNYFSTAPAVAQLTIKDREFSMVTARTQAHGDALYVIDNRSGRVAVLTYDAAAHLVRPHAVSELATVFAQATLPDRVTTPR